MASTDLDNRPSRSSTSSARASAALTLLKSRMSMQQRQRDTASSGGSASSSARAIHAGPSSSASDAADTKSTVYESGMPSSGGGAQTASRQQRLAPSGSEEHAAVDNHPSFQQEGHELSATRGGSIVKDSGNRRQQCIDGRSSLPSDRRARSKGKVTSKLHMHPLPQSAAASRAAALAQKRKAERIRIVRVRAQQQREAGWNASVAQHDHGDVESKNGAGGIPAASLFAYNAESAEQHRKAAATRLRPTVKPVIDHRRVRKVVDNTLSEPVRRMLNKRRQKQKKIRQQQQKKIRNVPKEHQRKEPPLFLNRRATPAAMAMMGHEEWRGGNVQRRRQNLRPHSSGAVIGTRRRQPRELSGGHGGDGMEQSRKEPRRGQSAGLVHVTRVQKLHAPASAYGETPGTDFVASALEHEDDYVGAGETELFGGDFEVDNGGGGGVDSQHPDYVDTGSYAGDIPFDSLRDVRSQMAALKRRIDMLEEENAMLRSPSVGDDHGRERALFSRYLSSFRGGAGVYPNEVAGYSAQSKDYDDEVNVSDRRIGVHRSAEARQTEMPELAFSADPAVDDLSRIPASLRRRRRERSGEAKIEDDLRFFRTKGQHQQERTGHSLGFGNVRSSRSMESYPESLLGSNRELRFGDVSASGSIVNCDYQHVSNAGPLRDSRSITRDRNVRDILPVKPGAGLDLDLSKLRKRRTGGSAGAVGRRVDAEKLKRNDDTARFESGTSMRSSVEGNGKGEDLSNEHHDGRDGVVSSGRSPQPARLSISARWMLDVPDRTDDPNASFEITKSGVFKRDGFIIDSEGMRFVEHDGTINDNVESSSRATLSQKSGIVPGAAVKTGPSGDINSTPTKSSLRVKSRGAGLDCGAKGVSFLDISPSKSTMLRASCDSFVLNAHAQMISHAAMSAVRSPGLFGGLSVSDDDGVEYGSDGNDSTDDRSSGRSGVRGDVQVRQRSIDDQSAAEDGISSPCLALSKYDVAILDVLGRGSCGVVYRAFHAPTLSVIALKTVSIVEKDKRRQLTKELRVLLGAPAQSLSVPVPSADGGAISKQSTPRISPLLGFIGAYLEDRRIYLGLEYMDGGSLQDLIGRRDGQQIALSEGCLQYIFLRVFSGLRDLHARCMVHRDVKPNNILFSRVGDVKISDFGILANLPAGAQRHLQDASNAHCKTFIGTVLYMSPERIAGDSYSFASDIWSAGLTLMTCALGRYAIAHQGHYQLAQRIKLAEKGDVSLGIEPVLTQLSGVEYSEELRDFCSLCLRVDPSERPTAEQLLQHPFLRPDNSSRVDSIPSELSQSACFDSVDGDDRSHNVARREILESVVDLVWKHWWRGKEGVMVAGHGRAEDAFIAQKLSAMQTIAKNLRYSDAAVVEAFRARHAIARNHM